MHGGVICVQEYQLITTTRTTFASYRVETAGTAGDGGGFYLANNCEAIRILESYGSDCSASKGQFGSVITKGGTQYSLNETTVLICGNLNGAQFGGLELKQTISSLNLNSTDCKVSLSEAGIEALYHVSAVFMTIMAIVYVASSDTFSAIESSNFVAIT